MSNIIRLEDVEQASAPLARLVAKAGEPLMRGDSFFRELVDALPAAVYTTDADGRITYFNEAAATLWGCRPELGKSEWCGSWRLFWPDGRPLPHDQCPMAIALKENRPVRGQDAIAERPDGTRVPFLPYPTPIYDAAGTLIGAVNMLIDMTEWKRAEGTMQHFAAIVESSDDAIISKDLNGIITSWNKGAERIFGYLAEEMIGKSIKTLIPADLQSEEDTIIERVRSGQRIEHYETVRQRKYGGLVDISLTVSPIKNAQGTIVGASKIARDITERKRDEAQIALLAREAEHRVKNVLATVQATVHLTQADTPDLLKQAIEGRIQALANVHALFVKSRWPGAELRSLVMQEILPYSQAGRQPRAGRRAAAIPGDQYGADDCRGVARADHQCRQIRQPVGAGGTRRDRVVAQGRRKLHAAMDRDRRSGGRAADAQGFRHPRDGSDGSEPTAGRDPVRLAQRRPRLRNQNRQRRRRTPPRIGP